MRPTAPAWYSDGFYRHAPQPAAHGQSAEESAAAVMKVIRPSKQEFNFYPGLKKNALPFHGGRGHCLRASTKQVAAHWPAPVFAAAVILHPDPQPIDGLRDSKKLTTPKGAMNWTPLIRGDAMESHGRLRSALRRRRNRQVQHPAGDHDGHGARRMGHAPHDHPHPVALIDGNRQSQDVDPLPTPSLKATPRSRRSRRRRSWPRPRATACASSTSRAARIRLRLAQRYGTAVTWRRSRTWPLRRASPFFRAGAPGGIAQSLRRKRNDRSSATSRRATTTSSRTCASCSPTRPPTARWARCGSKAITCPARCSSADARPRARDRHRVRLGPARAQHCSLAVRPRSCASPTR